MKKFIIKNPIASTIFIIIFVPLLIHLANKKIGYCYSENQIISDKEFFEIALKYAYENGKIKLSPADTSLKAYVENHPKCCFIEHNTNFMDVTLIGPYFRTIWVQYEMSNSERLANSNLIPQYTNLEINKEAYKYFVAGAAVDVCGKGLENTYHVTDNKNDPHIK